jgi:O-antigen/teichoic acid export membrane protein
LKLQRFAIAKVTVRKYYNEPTGKTLGVDVKRLGFTVVKNALANIVRGGATAMVALALPHFLTRTLDHSRFAAWVLMLQIAAYANYFDFGLQTAVARYLAQAMERGDDEQRDRLVSTAFVLLVATSVLAFIVLGVLILELPHLFQQVPASLMAELQSGLLVMAISAGLSLPMSTFTGVLIGLHRNEFTALAIGGSRILGAIAVLVAIHHTQSLFWLAVCLSVFTLLGGLFQCAVAFHLLPEMRVRAQYLSKRMALELIRYCLGLTVYSLSMLLVSGMDISIVGYFTFDAVGYYAIAATLITFVAGFSNSVFAAMMTPVAVLQTRGQLCRIRDLVIRTTQLGSYASLMITLPVFVYGFVALKLWVGPAYAGQALPILEVLLVAQAVRLIGSSYCTMLIATGQQRFGVAVALIEASVNFVFSIAGAVWLGPIGVAWGTLIGAVIAIICLFPLSIRWAREVPIPAWAFFREGILRPLIVATPILLYLALRRGQSPSIWSPKVLILAVLASIVLSVVFGGLLPPILRSRIISHAD